TIHANDTRDALTRLEMMVMMAGFDVPIPIIRQYITSAITLVIHLSRLKGGLRRVMRVSEIVAFRKKRYIVKDIFGFRQQGVRDGQAFGEFFATGYVPRIIAKLEASGLHLPESLFEKRVLAPMMERPSSRLKTATPLN